MVASTNAVTGSVPNAVRALQPGRFGSRRGGSLLMMPNPSDPSTVRPGFFPEVAASGRAWNFPKMWVPHVQPRSVYRLAKALLFPPSPLESSPSGRGGDREPAVASVRRPGGWLVDERWFFASDIERAIQKLPHELRRLLWEWLSLASFGYAVGDMGLTEWVRSRDPQNLHREAQEVSVRRILKAPPLTRRQGYTEHGLAFYVLAAELGLGSGGDET